MRSPQIVAAGGGVSPSTVVGMAPFDMGRFAIPSAMAQYRCNGKGIRGTEIDTVQLVKAGFRCAIGLPLRLVRDKV